MKKKPETPHKCFDDADRSNKPSLRVVWATSTINCQQMYKNVALKKSWRQRNYSKKTRETISTDESSNNEDKV